MLDFYKHTLVMRNSFSGCQTAVVEVNPLAQTLTNHRMKGVTNITNIRFDEAGPTMFKSYGIGTGEFIDRDKFLSLANCEQGDTDLVVLSDFTIKTTAGNISKPVKKDYTDESGEQNMEESLDVNVEVDEDQNMEAEGDQNMEDGEGNVQSRPASVYFCAEPGCSKVYQLYSTFENHMLIGKHDDKLSKCSTYDEIKRRWTDNSQLLLNDMLPKNPEKESHDMEKECLNMGWAHKKDRKNVRFSQNVKKFLTDKFTEGEVKGIKSNPSDISKQMKTLRDSEGKLVFAPHERLRSSQIASFFSRLAVLSKYCGERTLRAVSCIEDSDLEAVLQTLVEKEIRDDLN